MTKFSYSFPRLGFCQEHILGDSDLVMHIDANSCASRPQRASYAGWNGDTYPNSQVWSRGNRDCAHILSLRCRAAVARGAGLSVDWGVRSPHLEMGQGDWDETKDLDPCAHDAGACGTCAPSHRRCVHVGPQDHELAADDGSCHCRDTDAGSRDNCNHGGSYAGSDIGDGSCNSGDGNDVFCAHNSVVDGGSCVDSARDAGCCYHRNSCCCRTRDHSGTDSDCCHRRSTYGSRGDSSCSHGRACNCHDIVDARACGCCA